MPLYEYRCEPCGHAFETLIRSSADEPRCPKCRSAQVAKQFSVPAAAHVGGGARASAPAPIDCGAPACCGGGCGMG